jgi:Transcriptional regulator
MKQEDVSTFLAIVETRSISKAAEKLFLSQAAVSQRLKSLESEVGVTLIERRKGFKNIELTHYGNQFIDIAERWASLCQETEELKNKSGRMSMTIACNDSLATYMPLFKFIASQEPGIDLDIRTLDSEEIFDLIEKREADAGLLLNVINSTQVDIKPILTEHHVIVSKSVLADDGVKLSADAMNPEKEIVLMWGREYMRWRETLKIHPFSPHVRVNRMSMIVDFLDEKDTWAIVPETVAAHFSGLTHINIYQMSEAPPERVSCLIVHKNPRTTQKEAIDLFTGYLKEYLSTLKIHS